MQDTLFFCSLLFLQLVHFFLLQRGCMKDLVICGCDKICWLSLPEETEALAGMLITMTIKAV